MLGDFEHAYECVVDPEFPASGSFPNIHRFRAKAQQPHIVRLRHFGGVEWYTELGASELEKDGLTGAYTTPSPDHVIVVLNGRGYHVDARQPGAVHAIGIEPIKQVKALHEQELVLLLSPWQAAAFGRSGHLWTTGRIAADGARFLKADGDDLLLEVDMGDELHQVRIACTTGELR